MFDSVVLPAPFSPSNAWTSPGAASRSTDSSATTAGNRFVMPRSATAIGGGEARASPPELSARGATDHAFDEPVHRIEVLDRHALPFLETQLALLVVQGAAELVELSAEQGRLLPGDRRLRLCLDLRAVRGEAEEAVLEVAVVEAGLPGAVHRGLGATEVVRTPVVDRRGQPLLRRERVRVGVVADPRNALRLGELPRCRTVDVLPQHVRPGGDETLRGLLLLARIEPGVGPDQANLRARMRRLRAESERVGVPDDLRNRERHYVADHALLRRGAGRHPGEVDRVLASAKVFGEIFRLRCPGCLLKQHVRMLLRLRDHAILETERGREDELVPIADEALDHLARLRSFRNELFERRLDVRAKCVLHVETTFVVRLRPAVVVMWADVDPRRLESS